MDINIHNSLEILQELGWKYQPYSSTNSNRSVIIKSELIEYLKAKNFLHEGKTYNISNNSIEQIIRDIDSPELQNGLQAANQKIREALLYGITITEFINGKTVYPSISLIDWLNHENNNLLTYSQVLLQKTNSKDSIELDLVCYVNGLPLAIILRSSPKTHISNHKNNSIPIIYTYSQVLVSINESNSLYGALKIPDTHWTSWQNTYSSQQKSKKTSQQQSPYELTKKLFNLEYFFNLIRYGIVSDKKSKKYLANNQQLEYIVSLSKNVPQQEKYFLFAKTMYEYEQYATTPTVLFLGNLIANFPSINIEKVIICTEDNELRTLIDNVFYLEQSHTIHTEHEHYQKVSVTSPKTLIRDIKNITNTIPIHKITLLIEQQYSENNLTLGFPINTIYFNLNTSFKTCKKNNEKKHKQYTHYISEPPKEYLIHKEASPGLTGNTLAYYEKHHLISSVCFAIGEQNFNQLPKETIDKLNEIAQSVEPLINQAISENSLNPSNIDSAISKILLPKLFHVIGLKGTQNVIKQIHEGTFITNK